jgi:putative heme-binding domain-containing protein
MKWGLAWTVAAMTVAGGAQATEPPLTAETYNQWKEALPGGRVTTAGEIRAADGFEVRVVLTARAGEGSWVAMAFDPAGGVLVAREDRGLLRFDPEQGETAAATPAEETLEEVRGLLPAHGFVYANANNGHGFYRMRDADGDGRFEDVRLLRRTPGGVGHGRNQLALGPDGLIYSIHGDDVGPPDGGFTGRSVLAPMQEDRWLPLAWDRFNWSDSVKPPAGHVVRTDAEGTRWEVVCGGLRNPFGLAFNGDGEMFTYDADIEWDVGLPWYRPTRVLHLVSGADYGWRGGFRALPAWLPDTAPAAVDIGKGSPTAIAFGTRSHFPEPWRRALFIMDWAYGVIYAVDLHAHGASYAGRATVFLQGRPLNVTGLDFGPDGALYFITGGRRTQSAMYRVAWKGAAVTPAPGGSADATPEDAAAAARALRRRLESFHGPDAPRAVEEAWPQLGHADAWIRQAARVAVEAQPPARWLERALAEPKSTAALTALLAAARTAGPDAQATVRDRLLSFEPEGMGEDDALLWARSLQVSVLRHGPLSEAERTDCLARLNAALPHRSAHVNRLLCEMACALDDPQAVAKSLALLAAEPPPSQEDALHILLSLRVVRAGWSLETRRAYLGWLARARATFVGAAALPTTLNHLRAEVESALGASEREALAPELAAIDAAASPPPPAAPPSSRGFQKAWTTGDFPAPAAQPPDAARGRRLFVDAACSACHRAGAIEAVRALGPDLTGVGQRFDHRALMESMLEPWKVVAPPYRMASVTMTDGTIHEGPVVAEDEASLTLATNPVEPGSRARVARADVARLVERSAMPPALLNTFSREEILDLAAWLQAGAP